MDTSTPEPPRGQSPQFPLPTLFQQMSSTSLWPVLCLPLFYGKFIYDFWSKCDSYHNIETSFWAHHCRAFQPRGRKSSSTPEVGFKGKALKNFVDPLLALDRGYPEYNDLATCLGLSRPVIKLNFWTLSKIRSRLLLCFTSASLWKSSKIILWRLISFC